MKKKTKKTAHKKTKKSNKKKAAKVVGVLGVIGLSAALYKKRKQVRDFAYRLFSKIKKAS